MRFMTYFVFFITSLLVSCTNDNERVGQIIMPTEDLLTHVNFIPGTSVREAMNLLEADSLTQQMTVRISYPDHESEVEIDSMTADEAIKHVISAEDELLSFLVTQFDPNDDLEAPVFNELTADLRRLRTNDSLEVRKVTLNGHCSVEGDIIDYIEVVYIAPDISFSPPTGYNASITDWSGDPSYTPAGGTSSIYTSGTLQKFWMDSDSANSFTTVSDGLEIDTLIYPRWSAYCGSATSNMPLWYKDTEAFDFVSEWRTCSVGTIDAYSLAQWKLYWTWHSFYYFANASSPYIQINFQPTTWGTYVNSRALCKYYGNWCMYSRSDMPTRHLTAYYYNDAPGTEVSWTKN